MITFNILTPVFESGYFFYYPLWVITFEKLKILMVFCEILLKMGYHVL